MRPNGARLPAEDRGELLAHRVGDRVAGLGPEAPRLVVAAPAPRTRRRRGRRGRGRRRSGWPRRPAPDRRRPVASSAAPGAQLHQAAHHQVGERLEPGRGRDEHPPALEPVRAAAERLPLAHAGDRAGGETADPLEHGEGGGAAHPVGGEAHVALELDQRAGGVVAEDAVLPPGVEAEPVRAAAGARRRRRPAAWAGGGRAAGHRGGSRSRPAPTRSGARRCRRPGARAPPGTSAPPTPWPVRTHRLRPAGSRDPGAPRRTCRSRTASPRLPGRSTAGSLKR